MNRIIVLGVVGLAVAAGAAYWMTQGSSTTPAGQEIAQTDDTTFDASGIVEMSLGSADAKVTIIEYASFTCPHCANFHKGPFKQLKAEYLDNDKVHFIYRDVFFDQLGLWASMVARCGGRARFFGISDMMYNQQSDWIGSGDPVEVARNLRRIGKVAGLSEDQLNACLADDEKAKALVAWYQYNSEMHDVNSTPTLVINNRKYGNMNYADLKEIIEEKLAE